MHIDYYWTIIYNQQQYFDRIAYMYLEKLTLSLLSYQFKHSFTLLLYFALNENAGHLYLTVSLYDLGIVCRSIHIDTVPFHLSFVFTLFAILFLSPLLSIFSTSIHSNIYEVIETMVLIFTFPIPLFQCYIIYDTTQA